MKKISFGVVWDDIQKIREEEGRQQAINLANKYLLSDPYNIEAYLQIIDIYYTMWELEKSEKPIDFILANNLEKEWVDKWLLYYIKAVLLSERTEWKHAKNYIKKALKINNYNPEYKRVLSTIEFWSWNKERAYEILKWIIDENGVNDADILLDIVNIWLNLWYDEEAKNYVNLYYEKKDEISFFSKSKSYYDKKMENFKQVLFNKKS